MKPGALQEGLAHYQNGAYQSAFDCFEAARLRSPREPDAWYLSGLATLQLKQHDEAVKRIRHALSLSPDNAFYHLNLGNALQTAGQADEAEFHFRQALKIDPAFAAAHHNLANLLVSLQREDEAVGEYDQTLICDPRHPGALLTLSRLLMDRHQYQPSAILANRAAALFPGDREIQLKALPILLGTGHFQRVADHATEMLTRWPDDPMLLSLRGRAFGELFLYSEAIADFRQSLNLDPDQAITVAFLADGLARIGDPEAAIQVLRQYLARHPDDPELFSQRLFLLNYPSGYSRDEVLAEHRRWKSPAQTQPAVFANLPEPARRLRIGYVSADFRQHAVSFFIEPVLDHHDPESFEIYAYSSASRPDPVTARLKSKVAHFREIAGLSPAALRSLIVSDGIDLLIDLAGHSGGNRLPTFALKSAPVQLTWLGYPNTTGLGAIDYRISDAIADPPGLGDEWNTETVARLPDCFHCYRPESVRPIAPAPPSSTGGRITFGSFNVLAKLSDDTLAAWSRILSAVPNAQLAIKAGGLSHELSRQHLTGRLLRHGIDPGRVRLIGYLPRIGDHYDSYREIDLALDPFPYNGTTTTCDALWMGVPVVCLQGDRHASRVGASLIHAIGLKPLTDLITTTVDDYVRTAIALAGDPARLGHLHAALRPALLASPLMDEGRFTRNLERLYRDVWERWCATPALSGAPR